jgi:hypothetical protein
MNEKTPKFNEQQEIEKSSHSESVNAPEAEEIKTHIECPEQQEAVDRAIAELKTSFETLGIKDAKIPSVTIEFVESTNSDLPELGRVGAVHEDGSVVIFYDQRFKDPKTAERLTQEIRDSGIEYPGFEQTLKHELAHVTMWSLTHLDRQPATRLIDEGFASLVEKTNTQIPIEQTKQEALEGIKNEPENFNRCLDFQHPINGETENLNEAEYIIGRAILLWIRELKGNEKMLELIQKSPAKTSHNRDKPEGYDFASTDPKIHKLNNEYRSIITNTDQLPFEQIVEKATEWEGMQFEAALLEVTGFQNIETVKQKFIKWLNE